MSGQPSPGATAWVEPVERALRAHADVARAQLMRAYMKNQFEFLGVPTPIRRAATLETLKPLKGVPAEILLACAQALWCKPEREFQYVAADLLQRHARTLSLFDLETVFALAQQKSWWDTVDALAATVGDVAHRLRSLDGGAVQRRMDTLIDDADPWLRRIAMLHQKGWRADTDGVRLFGYALKLGAEPGFFSQKAAGWALRDYARHDPDAVRTFVSAHRAQLSALTRREAIKHCK